MNRSKGFTLLELLVVIAIIGILSTVVISSVAYARTKARNTYISSSVLEYVTAFSMYFSTNGTYPSPSDYTDPIKCLGHRTGPCGIVTYTSGTISGTPTGVTDTQLDAELETAYSAAPGFQNVLVTAVGVDETFFQGPTYECNLEVLGRCMSVNFIWYLTGNDETCVRNGTAANDGQATRCTLTLN
jgi:prepilin-type N-terminal cleavage/methylation domain-containing protein